MNIIHSMTKIKKLTFHEFWLWGLLLLVVSCGRIVEIDDFDKTDQEIMLHSSWMGGEGRRCGQLDALVRSGNWGSIRWYLLSAMLSGDSCGELVPAIKSSYLFREGDPKVTLLVEEIERRPPSIEGVFVALKEAERRSQINGHSALTPENAWVTQWNGEDHTNNCAFAAALGALRYLGKDIPHLDSWAQDLGGTRQYKQIMMLRKLGNGGTSDAVAGNYTAAHMTLSINKAGAFAETVTNTWRDDKTIPVALMKEELQSQERLEVFLVGGSAYSGWPEKIRVTGGHFVVATSYDSETDLFTVLDPLVKIEHDPSDPIIKVAPGPIFVTSSQMEAYMTYTGSENMELTRVTSYP